MRFSFLIITLCILTACVAPIRREKNPNVAKRPASTKRFLGKNDYYLEDRKKEATKIVIKEEQEELEALEFPMDKHYTKPKSFYGFTSNFIDESMKEAEPEDSKPTYEEEGLASWYGPGFHGRKTANGERFNQHSMTAAHRKLPMGSKVEVTNLENGKTVTVRINDRGPYSGKRIIDLSHEAASQLDFLGTGVAKVKIKQVKE